MRWAFALSILPCVALAADNGGYEVSLRTELQARYLSQTSDIPVPVGFFPSATLIRRLPQVTFNLTYAPQLIIGSTGPATAPSLLHQGRLSGEFRFAPDRKLTINEQGAYGTIDFLSLQSNQPTTAGAPLPRFQPLPSFTPIPYGNSTSQATLDWGFDKRVRGILDLNYLWGGGLNAGTALLPIQQQATGTASVAYALTRIDTLTTSAMVSHASFSNGPISNIAQVTEAWRLRSDRRSELILALGASGIQSQVNSAAGKSYLFFPAGQASFRTQAQSTSRWDFDLSATLGPYMDWISGTAYERVEASAGFRWTSKQEKWAAGARIRGALTVASTIPGPNQALAATEISASYAPRSDLRVELGSRVLWQRIPQFSPQPFYEWLTYVSLTVSARGIL